MDQVWGHNAQAPTLMFIATVRLRHIAEADKWPKAVRDQRRTDVVPHDKGANAVAPHFVLFQVRRAFLMMF